jgi:hypothetical protein
VSVVGTANECWASLLAVRTVAGTEEGLQIGNIACLFLCHVAAVVGLALRIVVASLWQTRGRFDSEMVHFAASVGASCCWVKKRVAVGMVVGHSFAFGSLAMCWS